MHVSQDLTVADLDACLFDLSGFSVLLLPGSHLLYLIGFSLGALDPLLTSHCLSVSSFKGFLFSSSSVRPGASVFHIGLETISIWTLTGQAVKMGTLGGMAREER